LEIRDWHIKKLWTFYAGKATKHGILPSEWNLAPVAVLH
jgi:hypothetical protein